VNQKATCWSRHFSHNTENNEVDNTRRQALATFNTALTFIAGIRSTTFAYYLKCDREERSKE
jgi:hypothetical protein